MKKSIGYTAIIISTLVIGMIIGFLVNGRFTKQRIKRMKFAFEQEGMHRNFVRAINPTPEQKENLKPILHRFAKKNRELMGKYRSDQRELFNELRIEVDPMLTDEQIKKMDRLGKEHQKRFKDRTQPHGDKHFQGSRNKRQRRDSIR